MMLSIITFLVKVFTLPLRLLEIATKYIFDNFLSFDNKEFSPLNLGECQDKIIELINKEWLSEKWLGTLANAVFNDCPIYLNLTNDWQWAVFNGSPKQDQRSFMKSVKTALKKLEKGKFKVKGTPYGKKYF